eukprot:scaffold281158_cov23-Tisochrysis_lutea.AAC.2
MHAAHPSTSSKMQGSCTRLQHADYGTVQQVSTNDVPPQRLPTSPQCHPACCLTLQACLFYCSFSPP